VMYFANAVENTDRRFVQESNRNRLINFASIATIESNDFFNCPNYEEDDKDNFAECSSSLTCDEADIESSDNEIILVPQDRTCSTSAILKLAKKNYNRCLPLPSLSSSPLSPAPSSSSSTTTSPTMSPVDALSTLHSLSCTLSPPILSLMQFDEQESSCQACNDSNTSYHSSALVYQTSSWINGLPSFPRFVSTSLHSLITTSSQGSISRQSDFGESSPVTSSMTFLHGTISDARHSAMSSSSSLSSFSSSFLDYTEYELQLSDTQPTYKSDLRSRPRPIFVVTTAALPWMTGTGRSS
jgi:hypothetical protein